MLKKSLCKFATVATMLAFSGFSMAGANTANVGVSATVSQNCTIGATALAFGSYDPLVTNATTALTASNGSVTVACTTDAASVTVGMGQGNNYSTGNRMKGAVNAV